MSILNKLKGRFKKTAFTQPPMFLDKIKTPGCYEVKGDDLHVTAWNDNAKVGDVYWIAYKKGCIGLFLTERVEHCYDGTGMSFSYAKALDYLHEFKDARVVIHFFSKWKEVNPTSKCVNECCRVDKEGYLATWNTI